MREQAEKLKLVEQKLSNHKGPFDLFALFLRENSPNKWDLVISSDWARYDKKGALKDIIQEIKNVFTDQELLMLSRVIILEKDDVALKSLYNTVRIEHGLAEISDSHFFGQSIRHAYFITSKRGSSTNVESSLPDC